MAPAFDQIARSTRPRAVSNGGLGGLVQVDQLVWDHIHSSKSTWPKRRKQRPPPIDVGIDGSLIFATMHSAAVVIQGCSTPATPVSPWAINAVAPPVGTMTPDRPSPPVSRYNVNGRRPCICQSTPETPEPRMRSQPVELPGSLLLPSQGFPQSEPPVTPLRQTFERSCSSDSSSTLCSTPGLSSCSTVTATDMEVLRSFSPKKKAAKPTTSSAPTISVNKIAKPFQAMTAEELIQCLPECSSAMISKDWIPAMLREHQKIKQLLQDASEIRLGVNSELNNFGTEIESISDDARKILYTYENVVQRAESLSERDVKATQEKLENAEAGLCEALAAIDGQRDLILEKEDAIIQKQELIKALQHNTDITVNVLGAFIEDTLPQTVHSIESKRVHEVMQLIADYSPATGGPRSPLQLSSPFLRIPETTFHAHLESLRDQKDLIKMQSAELDRHVIQYEKCLDVIKTRDDEIRLLVEEREEQKKIIEEYESGKRVSKSTRAEQERLVKQRQNMERTMKNMKLEHAKQIGHREAEIDNLRQKLNNAWEEVLARKADVKNVISQTQALLAPPEFREVGPDIVSAKERRLLGNAKFKSGTLSSSRSMLSLSISDATPGFGNLDVPAAPRSAVETITYETKPKVRMEPRSPRIDDEGWACGISRKKGSVPNLGRILGTAEDAGPRPRKQSLGAMNDHRRAHDLELLEAAVKNSVDGSFSAPALTSTEKALPTPPDTHSDHGSTHSSSDSGHSVTEDILHDLLLPEVPNNTPLSPIRNRVLSGIPEMSGEDADADADADSSSRYSSPSATSSDKEVYRKSIDALNLIEFMRESDMRGKKDQMVATATPDYEGSDYGPVEVGVAREVRVGVGGGGGGGVQPSKH